MKKYSILHIALRVGEYAPYPIICDTLKSISSNYVEIDWYAFIREKRFSELQNFIANTINRNKFDFCFMQIQAPNVLDVNTAKFMASKTFVINWTGDVRENIDWYKKIGKEIQLTLFTNETDVEKLKSEGINADYLQIGFDKRLYGIKKAHYVDYPEIVFCGNEYSNSHKFPLSNYRVDIVKKLSSHFQSRFKVFGAGWQSVGINTRTVPFTEESICYNYSKIAINCSHFAYKRYSSDRLIKSLASKCFTITNHFEGIEKEYIVGQHLESFKSIDELIYKCELYLKENEKREQIATAGYELAHSMCTWEYRIKQLIDLIQDKIC